MMRTLLWMMLCGLAGSGNVNSATWSWVGGATNLWSNGDNWNPATPPAPGPDTILLFNTSAAVSQNIGDMIVNQIEFGAELGGFTITTNPIAFAAGPSPGFGDPEIRHLAQGNVEFTNDLELVNDLRISGAGGLGTLTLGGTLVGPGGLTLFRAAASETILEGPEMRNTGGTVIESGQLVFKTTRTAPGDWALMEPGARLRIEGAGSLTLPGNSITGGGVSGIRGHLDVDGGSLTINGAGTIGTPGVDDVSFRLLSGSVGGTLPAVFGTTEFLGGTLAAGGSTSFFAPVLMTGGLTRFVRRTVQTEDAVTWSGGIVDADGALWEHRGTGAARALELSGGQEWRNGVLRVGPGAILNKSGLQITTFTGALNNDGVVSVAIGGGLVLNGGGTHTGNIGVDPAASLAFNGGTQSFSGGGTMQTGAGSSFSATDTAFAFNSNSLVLQSAGPALFSNATLGGTGAYSIIADADLVMRGSDFSGLPGQLALVSGAGTLKFEILNLLDDSRIERSLETSLVAQISNSGVTMGADAEWLANSTIQLSSGVIGALAGNGAKVTLQGTGLLAVTGTGNVVTPALHAVQSGAQSIIVQQSDLTLEGGGSTRGEVLVNQGQLVFEDAGVFELLGLGRNAISLVGGGTTAIRTGGTLAFAGDPNETLMISGSGNSAEKVVIEGGALGVSGDVEVRVPLELQSGFLESDAVNAELALTGMTWTGGEMRASAAGASLNLRGLPGGTLTLLGAGNKTLRGMGATFDLPVSWQEDSVLMLAEGAVWKSRESFSVQTAAGARIAGDATSSFQSTGTLTVATGTALEVDSPSQLGGTVVLPAGSSATFKKPLQLFLMGGAQLQIAGTGGVFTIENTEAEQSATISPGPILASNADADTVADFVLHESTLRLQGGIEGGAADFLMEDSQLDIAGPGPRIDVSHFHWKGGSIRGADLNTTPGSLAANARGLAVTAPAGIVLSGGDLSVDRCQVALGTSNPGHFPVTWRADGTIALSSEANPMPASTLECVGPLQTGATFQAITGGLGPSVDGVTGFAFRAGSDWTHVQGQFELQAPFAVGGRLTLLGGSVQVRQPGTLGPVEIRAGGTLDVARNVTTTGNTVDVRAGGSLAGGSVGSGASDQASLGTALTFLTDAKLVIRPGPAPFHLGASVEISGASTLDVQITDWQGSGSAAHSQATAQFIRLNGLSQVKVRAPNLVNFDFKPRSFVIMKSTNTNAVPISAGLASFTFDTSEIPQAGGTWSITVVNDELRLNYVTDPYDSWITGKGYSGASAAFDFDIDFDGLPNGLEFIMAGEPGVNDPAIQPLMTLNPDGSVSFIFRRNDAAAYLNPYIEHSMNLTQWMKLTPLQEVDDGFGIGIDQVTGILPAPRPDWHFFRVGVLR